MRLLRPWPHGGDAGLAPAHWAPCAGFTDVSTTASPFCPNVEWIKNRRDARLHGEDDVLSCRPGARGSRWRRS